MELSTAHTKQDAQAILAVLRGMHAEVGRALLDDRKAFLSISEVVQSAGARIVRLDGEIIGTYGLTRSPWWFSQEEAFWSMWFYVTPAHRDGPATRMLLEDIVDLVEVEGIPAYVHVYERPKASRAPVRRIGEEMGFSPSGRIMEIRGAE